MGDTRSIPSSEMIIEDLLENTDNKKNISKNTKNIKQFLMKILKIMIFLNLKFQHKVKKNRWTAFCL